MKIKSVSIKEEFFLNEFAGEFWIFSKNDYNNGSVSGLTALNGAFIYLWGQLEKGLTVDELIQALADKKNMDLDDAEADVHEFLARLINGNIVEVVTINKKPEKRMRLKGLSGLHTVSGSKTNHKINGK